MRRKKFPVVPESDTKKLHRSANRIAVPNYQRRCSFRTPACITVNNNDSQEDDGPSSLQSQFEANHMDCDQANAYKFIDRGTVTVVFFLCLFEENAWVFSYFALCYWLRGARRSNFPRRGTKKRKLNVEHVDVDNPRRRVDGVK